MTWRTKSETLFLIYLGHSTGVCKPLCTLGWYIHPNNLHIKWNAPAVQWNGHVGSSRCSLVEMFSSLLTTITMIMFCGLDALIQMRWQPATGSPPSPGDRSSSDQQLASSPHVLSDLWPPHPHPCDTLQFYSAHILSALSSHTLQLTPPSSFRLGAFTLQVFNQQWTEYFLQKLWQDQCGMNTFFLFVLFLKKGNVEPILTLKLQLNVNKRQKQTEWRREFIP